MTDLRAAARARERVEVRTAVEARHFGGRRIGIPQDEQELLRRLALEERLLLLARNAIRKNR